MWFVNTVFVFLQESSESTIEKNAIPFFIWALSLWTNFLFVKKLWYCFGGRVKFGFDKGRITTDKELESWYFKC